MRATTPSGRRIAVASFVGTAIEFYDFYIYGTAAALVFGAVFFPSFSPLASLATFAVGFVARPLGAILFGHFGDRIGRKRMRSARPRRRSGGASRRHCVNDSLADARSTSRWF